MLRVTTIGETDLTATLRVEGEVVSRWSAVLESECLGHLETQRDLVLDFSGVTLVDRRGAEIVRTLQARHIRVINCWPLVEDQIHDLSINGTV